MRRKNGFDRKRQEVGPPRVGEPPGVLKVREGAVESTISLVAYGPDATHEAEVTDLADIQAALDRFPVTWINVYGLKSIDKIQAIGDLLHLHPLALEDVLNIPQRPKAEDYGQTQFIVARMPIHVGELATEQVSLFFGERFVLAFQEQKGDCFEPIRTRIRDGRPRIRSSGCDYLAYAVLDAIVDAYFPLLETKAERLEELEFDILADPKKTHIRQLYDIKRDLVILRRYVWPLREILGFLLRGENPLVNEKTRLFLRDTLDHAVQALDLVESYRDIASGLMDLYLSMVSQRLNDVMKVLTIIATTFIPLSFIAGLYGMNFNTEISPWNLPELNWVWGYRFALGLMFASAGAMLAYFWRKGWFR